jgi:hypothetical protein
VKKGKEADRGRESIYEATHQGQEEEEGGGLLVIHDTTTTIMVFIYNVS